MNLQTEKITEYDERGLPAGEAVEEPTEVEATEEVATAPDDTTTETVGTPAKGPAKYRIGDREFATQDEALAFAQAQVAESQVTDAYRQGMRDALHRTDQPAENVTISTPALNPDELYTDPQAFLDKFATKIKTETRAELDQKEAIRTESDNIWREFTERHPMLADFRHEVENFTSQNLQEVRALIALKGRSAGYDYVATKLKSRFESYANAVKPKRELPNSGAGTTPAAKGATVTKKAPEKKPLSFAEQIRTLRKRP